MAIYWYNREIEAPNIKGVDPLRLRKLTTTIKKERYNTSIPPQNYVTINYANFFFKMRELAEM